jgi:hypothetical protein
VCTVAADEVPGLELLGRVVPAAEGAGDGAGLLPERDQLEASFDADVLGGEMLVQERFGLGLGDEQQERVGRVVEPGVE